MRSRHRPGRFRSPLPRRETRRSRSSAVGRVFASHYKVLSCGPPFPTLCRDLNALIQSMYANVKHCTCFVGTDKFLLRISPTSGQVFVFGAPTRTRTWDLLLKRE